jgi:hypothetical protein
MEVASLVHFEFATRSLRTATLFPPSGEAGIVPTPGKFRMGVETMENSELPGTQEPAPSTEHALWSWLLTVQPVTALAVVFAPTGDDSKSTLLHWAFAAAEMHIKKIKKNILLNAIIS